MIKDNIERKKVSPYDVAVDVLDCELEISKFEFQSCNHFSFRLETHPAMGEIVRLYSFDRDRFGIKEPTKVDMPLNKESKSKTKIE